MCNGCTLVRKGFAHVGNGCAQSCRGGRFLTILRKSQSNMALSKKELEKTKELARLYYLSGDTQKLVAEKTGVSRVTVNKWVSEGGWDALRTAKSITRKELVAKIMRKADERLESGEMTADEMAKLAASIEKIDKRTNATTIIEVLTAYNNWLVARTQIDKELTVDFLKMTNRYQDIFIAEQVSAETPAL